MTPTHGPGRNRLGCIGFGIVLALLCLSAAAGEPAEELTPAHRKELEQKAEGMRQEALGLLAQGRFPEGARQLQTVLELLERLYPEKQFPRGHHDLARCFNDLGYAFKEQGKYDPAREFYEKALRQWRKLYPDGHPGVANTLNNLGSLFLARGDYDRALSRYEQALAEWSSLFPEDKYTEGHPGTAMTQCCRPATRDWARWPAARVSSDCSGPSTWAAPATWWPASGRWTTRLPLP
jgi:tetratricopeptide (TPR) repeat protein